ncbi:ATP-binding cassette domain-containing protein, partial [Pantoea sp. QMID2]|uniref:ATP-binding cassette domain-containing protein n=1 Tax=Pantoea sp. QMID2 TaxID=3016791 RepID=UPI002555BFA1
MLKIEKLHVKINETDEEVIKGLNLTISDGEVHVIMGPNGTGKSTLSQTIM